MWPIFILNLKFDFLGESVFPVSTFLFNHLRGTTAVLERTSQKPERMKRFPKFLSRQFPLSEEVPNPCGAEKGDVRSAAVCSELALPPTP